MICPKTNCIYLKTLSGVNFCPQTKCLYENELKLKIADEISQIYKKRDFFDIADKNVPTHHSTYLTNRFIDEAYKERMERRKLIDPDGL